MTSVALRLGPLDRPRLIRLWLASIVLVSVVGCDPTLPHPPPHKADGATGLALGFEPQASADALPKVVWINVENGGASAPLPDDVSLVDGPISDTQMRSLSHGQPTIDIQERTVPTTRFVRGNALVIAPSLPLHDGLYSIAVASLGVASQVTVIARPRDLVLKRQWPPSGAPSDPRALFYCDTRSLSSTTLEVDLQPGDFPGSFVSGEPGFGHRCFHFQQDAGASLSSSTLIPPPSISWGSRTFMLDPTPLQVVEAGPAEIDQVTCASGELPIGPGCAFVDDDRLVVRPPHAPLLWFLEGPSSDRHFTSEDGAPVLIKGLAPSSIVALTVTTVDITGQPTTYSFQATTQPAHSHLIINEVYANPVGPEPAQEFVELYNDGAVAADLSGLTLSDVGGETELPEGVLLPQQFALVVPDAYVLDDEVDPMPPPDALVLRVPKLGKNGLSNEGEPLTLRGVDGSIVSRFPALPKPKSGVSVVRITPSALDGAAGSFALSGDGASPALPNVPRPAP